jgi:ABC-type branched-subunit amino acid transport system substrate-binding protein
VSPDPAPQGTLELVRPAGPASAYPARARALLRRIAERSGIPDVPVEALYGYEAMRVALAAVDAAGPRPRDRETVVRAAMRSRSRASALGPYSIGPAGDVAPARFADYRVQAGAARFLGFRAPGPASGRP